MIKYWILLAIVQILGLVIGFYMCLGYVLKRASDGVCIRADDGEVYLQISEEGQKKLADPDTRILFLKVINISTRNKQAI
jgi:hypothetical protein